MLTPDDLSVDGFDNAAALDQAAADPSASEPDRLRAAHNRAVREMIEGSPEAALERFESVAAKAHACGCLQPAQRNLLLYNQGIALLLAGREDAAFEALTEARRAKPHA